MGLWVDSHTREARSTDATAQPPSVVFADPHLRLRTSHLMLAVVVIVTALATGWAARSLAGSPVAVPEPNQAPVDLGAIRVTVAGTWSREPLARSGVQGLDPRTTSAFAPALGLRAHAVVTIAPLDDRTLVPEALRAQLAQPLPSPRRTTLLGVPAWHYPAQALSHGRMIELTVAVTSAGSLTVACLGHSSSWSAATGCAAGLRQLSIEDARWLAPASDLMLRRSAPAVVERLDARRRTLRARLRGARSRRAQSRISGRLATAYDRAGGALAPVAPAAGAAHDLVAALRDTADAHRRLARAAALAAPRRFRRARAEIGRGDARVRAALGELR